MSTSEWWLPLSKAAEIVRSHLAPGQSAEEQAEELDRQVDKTLRGVFASGEVRTLLSGISPGFEGEFLLHAEAAAGEFFSINIAGNYLLLRNVGGRYEALLHSADLRSFLAVHMPRVAIPPSQQLEDDDLQWLTEEVRLAKAGSKKTLERRAKQMRNISLRKFRRLWPEALARAGRPDLSDPGRPGLKS